MPKDLVTRAEEIRQMLGCTPTEALHRAEAERLMPRDSWVIQLPLLVNRAMNGSDLERKMAIERLMEMAKLADKNGRVKGR